MLHQYLVGKGRFLSIFLLALAPYFLSLQERNVSWSKDFGWRWLENCQIGFTTILDLIHFDDTFYAAISKGVYTIADAFHREQKPLNGLSNSGVSSRDSSLIATLLKDQRPLFLINTSVNSPIEVDGRFYNAVPKNADGSLDIFTSHGIFAWGDTQVSIASVTLEELGWEEFLGMTVLEDESKSSRQVFLFFRESKGHRWQLYNPDEGVLDASYDWLLYSYDGYGKVSIGYYEEKYEDKWRLYIFAAVIVVLVLSFVFVLIRQRKSKSLRIQSLKYGWRPFSQRESSQEVLLLQLMEHDLKGGMNILKGLLKYLPETKPDAWPSVVEQCIQMIDRLKKTICQRLDPIYRTPVSENTVSLKVLLQNVLEEVKGYARMKKVRILNKSNLKLEIKHHEVLERALHICLDNAIKYSPPLSEIEITSVLTGDTLTVQIIDSGVGLPKDWKLGAEGSQRVGVGGERGMGMALTIISRMMLRYHGYVTLERREDRKGTIAILEWPVGSAHPMSSND